jgi:hypothetical protein
MVNSESMAYTVEELITILQKVPDKSDKVYLAPLERLPFGGTIKDEKLLPPEMESMRLPSPTIRYDIEAVGFATDMDTDERYVSLGFSPEQGPQELPAQ